MSDFQCPRCAAAEARAARLVEQLSYATAELMRGACMQPAAAVREYVQAWEILEQRKAETGEEWRPSG